MRKRIVFTLAACILAAVGCSKKEEKEAEPVAPVQVAPVEMGSIRRIVEADAILYPYNSSNVMPKIQAPVQRFLVNRGDHVKQGQLLAVLENHDLEATANAAKAQLDQAAANLASLAEATIPEAVVKAQTDVQSDQEQFDAAQTVLASRRRLLEQGALARKSVDDAQVTFAQAKAQLETAQEHLRTFQKVGKQAQVDAAKAAVATADAQYRSAVAQVGYSEVRALISGVVSDRPIYPGDMAQPGTPLLSIVDISRVVARANVPQAQSSDIRVGMPATIKIVESGEEVPGKVTVVSPATDPASTTVQIWVQADNPGERLKPGATVRVSVVTEILKNVVLVPAPAILPGEEGGTAVMVLGADSTVHQKKVEVGVREADKVQIVSGVSPGDQVVTVGGVGVDDNAKVRIVQPGEKDEDEKPDADAAGKDAKKD